MLILSIASLLKNLICSCFSKRKNKDFINSEFPNGLMLIKTRDIILDKERPKTGNLSFELKFKFFLF